MTLDTAHERIITRRAVGSPLIESRPLSEAAQCNVHLKLDAMQPCGSFKLRGVGHACEVYRANGAKRFVSSSEGNAGLAVAYAGRCLNIPVVVVVPQTTTERAKELLNLEGAQVIVHGGSWQEANELAQTLIGPDDAFIHPFDDPLLWTGHATMIDEVAASGYKPDVVVLSVGGGGLLSGVVEGLQRNGWNDVPVVAVETQGAASFHAATLAGKAVEIEKITSVATSLGAKRVCDQAVEYWRRHPIESLVVTDREALNACDRFLFDHRVLVEPACGAALAAAYFGDSLSRFERALVIVCGGATASYEQIKLWLAKQ